MNQFTLLPTARKYLRRAVHIRNLITVTSFVALIVILPMINAMPFGFTLDDNSSLILPEVMFVALYAYDLRKATRTASSYKLSVSTETISREVDGASAISIPVQQVRYITRYDSGSYVITGTDILKPITIPAGIERAEELEALLTSLTGATIHVQSFNWYVLFGMCFALIVAMMGAMFAESKYLATVLGSLAIGLLIYCWTVFQRSKDYDKKMRLFRYGSLIPAIAIAIRIILHWT